MFILKGYTNPHVPETLSDLRVVSIILELEQSTLHSRLKKFVKKSIAVSPSRYYCHFALYFNESGDYVRVYAKQSPFNGSVPFATRSINRMSECMMGQVSMNLVYRV
jgi:hypothetical protein